MLQCNSIFIMPGYFYFLLISLSSRFPAGLRVGAPGATQPLAITASDHAIHAPTSRSRFEGGFGVDAIPRTIPKGRFRMHSEATKKNP